MRRFALAAALIATAACGTKGAPGDYLYVWAGDSAATASDFLAVIDANPASPHYGAIVASLPTGTVGSHPHHTEAEMPADNHLLANGFHAGKTWLFDLTNPRAPRILTTFGDLAGFSHPHTFVRLADGNLIATFQYRADASTAPMHEGMTMPAMHTTGGLVQLDERGTVMRSSSARDTTIADPMLYPYSVLPMPSIDRAVSTTTDMDHADTVQTAQWVQIWRWSDLTLLRTIALPPGPRGNEQNFTGEPRLLPDGRSVYIHTFNCGLYLLRDLDSAAPRASFVMHFTGEECGVPILTGHWWLQPVPADHAVVALDISDPEHPRQVSSVKVGDDESPHWLALDPTGRRLVMNSGGSAGNRLFVIDFDPASGKLALDEKFRDPGAAQPGVRMTGKTWPHGFAGTAVPHGSVFSR